MEMLTLHTISDIVAFHKIVTRFYSEELDE